MTLKQRIVKVIDSNVLLKRATVWTLMKLRRADYMKYYRAVKKTDEDLVVFESFGGRSFACNPKALYLRMSELPEWRDKKKIWCFRNPDEFAFLNDYPNTEVVKFRSPAYYRAFATAQYAVFNSRLPKEIKKRPEQMYLQTWHGVPLKRLGYDIASYKVRGMTNKKLQKGYDITIDQCSRFLSPSDYYTKAITSAFNLEGRNKTDVILQKGYPRNDFLYSHTEADVKKIRESLGLPEGKKVILYCPTYRDNQSAAGVGHTYELGIDFDALRNEIGGDCCVLFRTHYFINNVFDFEKYKGFIWDVSKYPDINELYIVSDMLITDYSSVMFDYAVLKRPILLYMYDFDEYKNELRDFYLDLEELPSGALFTQQQLTDEIKLVKDGFVCPDKYREFNERHNALNGLRFEQSGFRRNFEYRKRRIDVKISIIVPIRSGENYLRDCLDSLKAQTFKDFEIIAVLDRFPQADFDRIASDYPELSVGSLIAVGEGCAAARNTGLKAAEGEFVFFLDVDDYLEESFLEKLVTAADENGADLVSGRFQHVRMGRDAFLSQETDEDADTAEAGEEENELAEEQIDPEDNTAAGRLIKRLKKLGRVSALRTLVKREIVSGLQFDESYVYYSDIPWVSDIISLHTVYAYADDAVYYKRGHNDPINDPALSQIRDDDRFDEFMRAYADAVARAKRPEIIKQLNRKLIKYYTGTFALSMKRKPEKVWRKEHFDTISKLVAEIDPAIVREFKHYQRRLCKAAKKHDRKLALMVIKRRLMFKKLRKISKSKNARCKSYYVHLFKDRPIKPNYVLCESFFGKSYADSPKYIYEYLCKNYPGKYKFVWVLDNTKTPVPFNPIKIHRYSLRYAYYLAVCKYYVFNMRQPEWVKKKDENVILETWHGIPIKRLMFDQDEITGPNTRYKEQVYNQTRAWDYLVSPNPYCTEIFKSCFMFDGDKIIETGYPRNDLLHADNTDKAVSVRKALGIPEGKKVIMYAPTFRDNEFYAIGAYKYKQALDFDLMQKRLGDDYVLLMRTHYIIADAVDTSAYKGFIYNVSKYDDINELYLISDILITDYSSVSFDFANLKRPMLYYTYDLEQYRDNLRGFYIDIEKELPGPLLFDSEEVVSAIENIDVISEKYKGRYEEFYDKYCGLEDGNCSKRVVEAVFGR